MGPTSLRLRRRRSGVSMIEMAVVVAIIGILAAIGSMMMTGTLPSWRTRQGATDFAAVVNLARNKAIADGYEYRVRVVTTDADIDGDSANVGVYTLERGNKSSGSDVWDILPVDDNGPDTAEGTYDIGMGGDEQLRGVSIAGTGSSAVDGDDIVVSPRGFITNPDADFDSEGHITVTFVNKTARIAGESDERVVQISRSGMVRLVQGNSTFATSPIGASAVSNTTATAGGGYNP